MNKRIVALLTFILLSGYSAPVQINQFLVFDFLVICLNYDLYAEEVPAGDYWKAEFAEISSKTVVAMGLQTEELQTLVLRCDKLLPVIENLEETPRKIYLKRINKMKSLFEFVVNSRTEGSE